MVIDDGDVPMGGVDPIPHRGEYVPVLVEWKSTDEFGPIHLEVTGTPAPGQTLTFVTTGRPGLTAFMLFGRPGQRFIPTAGTLFVNTIGLIQSAWPATPSRVARVVPAGVSGLYHVQEVALGGGSVAVSNYVPLQF